MDDGADPAPLPSPSDITVVLDPGTPGPVWDELADRAAHYDTRARGDGTRRTYRSAWTHFSTWCASLGREPLSGDAELVAMYIVRRADDDLAVSSLRVALAAIRTAHLLAGVPLDLSQPRFRMTLEGVVRSRGVRPSRQATPAVPEVLAKMLDALPAPDSPLGIRNRAMLLLGFGAALRRSELVGLRIGDVARVTGRGLTVLVRFSKTDQHGRGQEVAIWANPTTPLTCPLAALERWLVVRETAADMTSGLSVEARRALPLFCGMSKAGRLSGTVLSDKAVARLVSRGRRPRPRALFRSLAPCRPRHRRRRPGLGPGRSDAPDKAQIHRGGTRLSPSRRPLAQQRHRAAVCANPEAERIARCPERSCSTDPLAG